MVQVSRLHLLALQQLLNPAFISLPDSLTGFPHHSSAAAVAVAEAHVDRNLPLDLSDSDSDSA